MTSEAIYCALMKLERYEDALVQIQNASELLAQRIGKDKRTFEWGRIQARIGHTLVELKRYEEAVGHLVEGYHQMVKSKKYQPPYDSDQIPEARMGVYEALRLQLEYDPNLPDAAKTRLQLGIVLLELKKYADAEPLLISYYEDMKLQDKDIAKGGNSRIPKALDRLIELYTATGDSNEVDKYRLLRANFQPKLTSPPKEQK